MPKYRANFALNPHDIEIIERAIRSEISSHATLDVAHHGNETSTQRVRELNRVLAKIFHQKVFYSQVNRTGVPGG